MVDGGNAHFADTRRRQRALEEHGLHFVGMGVSGGEEGALNGPSIMVGGSEASYARLGADPGVDRRGRRRDAVLRPRRARRRGPLREDGAQRHRVRRHAADRGVLRPAAQRRGPGAGRDRGRLRRVERRGPGVLPHRDHRGRCSTTSTPRPASRSSTSSSDAAEQKGTGRWTVQSALDLGVPVTGIAEATFAAACPATPSSAQAARQVFETGPRAPVEVDGRHVRRRRAGRALRLQGGRLRAGLRPDRGRRRGARLGRRPGQVATIWRGGCIIRARFLDRISEAYADEPDLTTLLTTEFFADAVESGVDAWRRVVATAVARGVPMPAFGSSLSYFDGLRRERLPAALIQALRDNFGAHTYQRSDREGTFHTAWAAAEPRPPWPRAARRSHDRHRLRHLPHRRRPARRPPRLRHHAAPRPGRLGPAARPRRGGRACCAGPSSSASTSSTPPTPTGPYVAEELIREALHPYPDDVVIATKAGLTRAGPGRLDAAAAARAYLRQQCELSLRRLGVERIDLFQLHRIDPTRPARGPGRRAEGAAGRGQDPPPRPLRGRRRAARGRAAGRRRS